MNILHVIEIFIKVFFFFYYNFETSLLSYFGVFLRIDSGNWTFSVKIYKYLKILNVYCLIVFNKALNTCIVLKHLQVLSDLSLALIICSKIDFPYH